VGARRSCRRGGEALPRSAAVTPRPVTNIGASVRQRLLNLGRERGEPFDQLLQYYAIERFLARLARTPWADVLVVKGATLLRVWNAPLARPTRDIDFHTQLADATGVARKAVAEIVAVEMDDGLVFERDVASEPIVVDGRYPGVRLAVRGSLAGARFKLQVDVGVGAEAVPEPAWVGQALQPRRRHLGRLPCQLRARHAVPHLGRARCAKTCGAAARSTSGVCAKRASARSSRLSAFLSAFWEHWRPCASDTRYLDFATNFE